MWFRKVLPFLLTIWACLGTDKAESEGMLRERMKSGTGDNVLAAGSVLTEAPCLYIFQLHSPLNSH